MTTMTPDDLGSLFESDVIPDDPNFAGVSTDPVCEVCGVALDYGGRGRKPKYCDEHRKSGQGKRTPPASGRRSATREVDVALASLDQLNGILTTGLFFASPNAAAYFAQQGQKLEDRNRTVLEANPELAKKIAKATGKTGALGLIISYGLVIAPCIGIIRDERAAAYDDGS